MRKPSMFLALLLSSLLPIQAAGAEWERIGQTGQGAQRGVFDIHMPSIVSAGRTVRAWVSDSYDAEQELPRPSTTRFRSRNSYYEFDCQLRELSLRELRYYSGPYTTGETVDSWKPRSPEFDPVVPGSIAERMLTFVCKAAKAR